VGISRQIDRLEPKRSAALFRFDVANKGGLLQQLVPIHEELGSWQQVLRLALALQVNLFRASLTDDGYGQIMRMMAKSYCNGHFKLKRLCSKISAQVLFRRAE
jgi:hypothetical protein